MSKRPGAITLLGWLFVAVGSVAFFYHLSEFKPEVSLQTELMWICLVRLLAVVGGVLMLYGHNSGRWLLGAWMLYHIVLSFFHSPVEFGMHLVLFGVMGYFLFRPAASAYFHGRPSEPPARPNLNP